MEELDLLKKDWQQNNHENRQVSENQIYGMLQTQSSSVVKWILIIGIVEFIFWFGIAIFSGDDNEELVKVGLGEYLAYLDAITYFNYAVILVFIYLFYKNYRSISTISNTKTLMKSIIKVRKTVHFYVAYNLSMLGLLSFIVSILTLLNIPELESIRAKALDGNHTLQLVVVFGLIFVFVAIIVFVFWIFYKIIYGILLKKLFVNYQELKKIDL